MINNKKYLKIIVFFILSFIIYKGSFAQCIMPSNIICEIEFPEDIAYSTFSEESLEDVIQMDTILKYMPQSTPSLYVAPNSCEMYYWCLMLEELLENNDLQVAAEYAYYFNYELTVIDEEGDGVNDYYLLDTTIVDGEDNRINYWGIIHIEQSTRDASDGSASAAIGNTTNWGHLATAIGNIVPLNSLSNSSTVNVISNPVPIGIYQACELLTSASNISSTDTVIFRAGARVRLRQGFRVDASANSHFRAHICNHH